MKSKVSVTAVNRELHEESECGIIEDIEEEDDMLDEVEVKYIEQIREQEMQNEKDRLQDFLAKRNELEA